MIQRFKATPLSRFIQFPRRSRLERWIQTRLVRLAAWVTQLRGLSVPFEGPYPWFMWQNPIWQTARLGIISLAFRCGLIHASLTFIAWASSADESGGAVSTLDTTTTLNIALADVLVDWCKHEGTTTTFATAKTTGGNSGQFDADDKVTHSNSDLEAQFGFVLSAAADATHTRRMTLGAARTFPSLITAQFRPDAGEVITKDTSNTGQGNSAAPTSGNITTTGLDYLVMGGYGEYIGNRSSAHQINGVAATAVRDTDVTHGLNFTAAWYRLPGATFAGGHANCTNASADWICNIIAIKSEPAGAQNQLAWIRA